jgi:hypothetical protein
MNKQTRILTAVVLTIVLGGFWAHDTAQQNDIAYQSQPAVCIITDFFCASIVGLIFYFGSGWLAKRKGSQFQQTFAVHSSGGGAQQPPPPSAPAAKTIHSLMTNKYPPPKIAEIVLRYSVAVAGETAEIAERASCVKINDVTHYALLQEVFAYHLNLAIATVMIKDQLHGKDNYDQIETGICDVTYSFLKNPGAKMTQYLPILSTENRERARMYFLNNADGLGVSNEQVQAYAEKHNKKLLTDIPADQMALVYYSIRVARLLEIGSNIDKVIVWGANAKLTDRIFEMRDEILQCLN